LRIRIIHPPNVASIDSIRVDGFTVGECYEVGTSLGSVFLAEGWAVPVEDNPNSGLAPLKNLDPPGLPPNLIIERASPSGEYVEAAADRPVRLTRARARRRSRRRH
jgi:hypothetical protein